MATRSRSRRTIPLCNSQTGGQTVPILAEKEDNLSSATKIPVSGGGGGGGQGRCERRSEAYLKIKKKNGGREGSGWRGGGQEGWGGGESQGGC